MSEEQGAHLVLERPNQDPIRDRTGDACSNSNNAAKHRRSRPLQQLNITLSKVRDYASAQADQQHARLCLQVLRQE